VQINPIRAISFINALKLESLLKFNFPRLVQGSAVETAQMFQKGEQFLPL
jgi:hypothetical protein